MTDRPNRSATYYDIGLRYEDICSRWGCFVHFEVTPPLRVAGARAMHSAIATLFVRYPSNRSQALREASMRFGRAEACETLPEAMRRCLDKWEADMREREEQAKRQARF